MHTTSEFNDKKKNIRTNINGNSIHDKNKLQAFAIRDSNITTQTVNYLSNIIYTRVVSSPDIFVQQEYYLFISLWICLAIRQRHRYHILLSQ